MIQEGAPTEERNANIGRRTNTSMASHIRANNHIHMPGHILMHSHILIHNQFRQHPDRVYVLKEQCRIRCNRGILLAILPAGWALRRMRSRALIPVLILVCRFKMGKPFVYRLAMSEMV
jgi:hypothetical protein